MSRPGTAGVADYFAILGVGDTLVLKSTQKSTPVIEDEAPPVPMPMPPQPAAPASTTAGVDDDNATDLSTDGGGAGDASTAPAAMDGSSNDTRTDNGDGDEAAHIDAEQDRCFGTVEEECAWTERFYREIVDVRLVTAEHNDDIGGGGGGGGGDFDARGGEGHAGTGSGPDPRTGNKCAPSAAIGVENDNNDGYEVVRRTAAALAPMMTVRMGKVTAEEQGRDADLNPMSSTGLRAAAMQSHQQELEAARTHRAAVGATSGAAGDDGGIGKTPSKVLSGLKSKVGTKLGKKLNPILQASASQEWLQGAMSTSPRVLSSSSRMDGSGSISSAASPLHRSGISNCRRRTYHVAFRRRGPDEVDRPAIADLAVCFAKLHRSTIIREDGATCEMRSSKGTATGVTTSTTTTTGTKPAMATNSTTAAALAKRGLITGAGLATQMAMSGANRLMASRSNLTPTPKDGGGNSTRRGMDTPRETTPRVSRKHFFPDTVEKPPRGPGGQKQQPHMTTFQLSDLLELPSGYDEWSIPEPYQSLMFPTPTDADGGVDDSSVDMRPTSPEARLRRTFLFSHTSSALEAGLSPSEASGAGIEALLRTNSPSLSVTSSRGPSPISSERIISQMPNNLSTEAQESDYSWEQNLEALVPQLLTSDSIPSRRDGEISYEYVPILAIRRQRVGDEERYHEDPAAVDVSVSFLDAGGNPKMFGLGEGNDDDDEEDEEDEVGGAMSVLRKTGWRVAADTLVSSMRRAHERRQEDSSNTADLTGIPVLLIRHNTPQGFADAPFATSVLDRFPSKNYKGLPMPEEELPMFCYPTGCRLHRAKFQDAPLAHCYGFVVKNEQGDSIHVSCVSFMEPLTREKSKQLDAMTLQRRRTSLPHRRFYQRRRERCTIGSRGQAGKNQNLVPVESVGSESDSFLMTGFEERTTFENKTICLISRFPFWTAFRRFLSHLHIMSGSSSDLPLERCISHLLLSVPVPRPGGPTVFVPLPTQNSPMEISLPPTKDLPLLDLPFQRLFGCLDVPSVVTTVLGFLALERKVIIMSTHPSLVSDSCELLRSLLFPFELCAPYVPRLTQPFMSCLDFPGAIFVGIHDDMSEDGLAASVRRNMPEDSVIIDLDSGDIDCSGDRYEVLKQCWNIIPSEPRTILVQELETLCRDAGLVPGQEPIHSQFDPAFDASVPVTTSLVEDLNDRGHKAKEPLDDRAIRDSFLRFFCSILGGYERFLVVPDMDFVISGDDWFDAKGFLSSVSQEHAPYLGSLTSTQLFQSFIQRRTEASDFHCVLFDDCLSEFHSTTVAYGRLGGDVETVTAPDGEDPQVLFSLLVDQCATELHTETTDVSVSDITSRDGNKSAIFSVDESETESHISPPFSQVSATRSVEPSLFVAGGDHVTAPSRRNLNEYQRFVYCVDGNPCFPNKLRKDLFYPSEPEKLSVILNQVDNPVLTRSDREMDESNRRRKLAVSQRGLHNQRRCLWQLPKLMGSHVLGAWLMCIPPLVSQSGISSELQSKYLLRALGAMRSLRSRQRIIPDEAAYRCLMIACGRASSDRRVELVKLFGLLRSDGIFPSAVTLGQYTRAIAEGFSKRSSGAPDDRLTESALRQSLMGEDDSAAKFRNTDAGTILNVLDANLSILEDSGRRWRHRQPRDNRTDENNAAEQKDGGTEQSNHTSGADSPSAKLIQHKAKSLHKSWLPASCSTSFAPTLPGRTVNHLSIDDFEFVAIWSRTTVCESCSYIPLDEEVMGGWDVMQNESEDSFCDVSCPRCGAGITPLLGYRVMAADEALSEGEGTGFDASLSHRSSDAGDAYATYMDLPPQIRPFLGENLAKDGKCNYVTYLSPSSMRLLLEQYVEEHGEDVLERETLRKLDPRLYYNLWWFSARFSLPLPLMVESTEDSGGYSPKHLSAFVAWDRSVAEKACESGAKAILTLLSPASTPDTVKSSRMVPERSGRTYNSILSADLPLLSQFNLQSYAQSDWDHADLSKILVTLVEACDKKDFLPVIECVCQCNENRRGGIDMPSINASGSAVESDVGASSVVSSGANQSQSNPIAYPVEFDCYRTLLYLARYQCTSAFHNFFPATAKACKGYHFWCVQGTPNPFFDRFFRDAVKRLRTNSGALPPIHDTSDIAIGFRCVFGHVI